MKNLSFLIKPASSSCNLKCKYCFYADVSEHRQIKSNGIMKEEVMKKLIVPERRHPACPHRLCGRGHGGGIGVEFADRYECVP